MSNSWIYDVLNYNCSKNMTDSPVFKRFKLIQTAEKKCWRGVDVDASGKPGGS